LAESDTSEQYEREFEHFAVYPTRKVDDDIRRHEGTRQRRPRGQQRKQREKNNLPPPLFIKRLNAL